MVCVEVGGFDGRILTSHQNEDRGLSSDLGKPEKTLHSLSETSALVLRLI